VYNGIAIEDFGTPVVILANRGFVKDAHSAASGKGMPGLRILAENVACESTVTEDIESGVAAVMPEVVSALTRPLTAEEKSPGQKAQKPSRIVLRGNFEEVNRFLYAKGWTDGLPVSPPTEKAVAEMMTGTDLPPDHLVARIIPRLGKATVEKIAVNAVMAGALPTHLPVLIAAVQALADPKTRFDTFEVSTGSWAPFFAVNGPVRNDINVNCSSGALSPGNIANAAIGRAVGLIVKNIGGARKGVEDMGVIGNPAKYTLVLGENEEESPWEPLHVELGYKKEDSTVTVFFPNSYSQTIPAQTSAQGIGERLASLAPNALSCLVVIPDHAQILSSEGWTKKRLREFIVKNAPRSQFNTQLKDEDFIVVVAGGPGVWMAVLKSAGGFENSFVTKKIELPRSWNKLVAKYKDVVPNYEGY
jgi:hypothetical protein